MSEWPEMLVAVKEQISALTAELEARGAVENWAAKSDTEDWKIWRTRAINLRYEWLKVKGRYDKAAKKNSSLQAQLTSVRAHLAAAIEKGNVG